MGGSALAEVPVYDARPTLRLPGRERPRPKVNVRWREAWPNHGKVRAASAGRLASRVPFASQTAKAPLTRPGPRRLLVISVRGEMGFSPNRRAEMRC